MFIQERDVYSRFNFLVIFKVFVLISLIFYFNTGFK